MVASGEVGFPGSRRPGVPNPSSSGEVVGPDHLAVVGEITPVAVKIGFPSGRSGNRVVAGVGGQRGRGGEAAVRITLAATMGQVAFPPRCDAGQQARDRRNGRCDG